MLAKLIDWGYRYLWKPVGRPFTYTMRQWSQQNRILSQLLALLSFSIAAWGILWTTGWWQVILVICYGFLSALWGHIFWDTRGSYIKHREDFDDDSSQVGVTPDRDRRPPSV